jgi:hypothetical protein
VSKNHLLFPSAIEDLGKSCGSGGLSPGQLSGADRVKFVYPEMYPSGYTTMSCDKTVWRSVDVFRFKVEDNSGKWRAFFGTVNQRVVGSNPTAAATNLNLKRKKTTL